MTRMALVLVAVVGSLACGLCVLHAQDAAPKKDAAPKVNRVYIKILVPADPPARAKDQLGVESWIAEAIQKRGKSKFTAATGWMLIPDVKDWESEPEYWDGRHDGKQWACPVDGSCRKRADGRVEVQVSGWGPAPAFVKISLKDEPGSREVVAVEELMWPEGPPHVAVLIAPPADREK